MNTRRDPKRKKNKHIINTNNKTFIAENKEEQSRKNQDRDHV